MRAMPVVVLLATMLLVPCAAAAETPDAQPERAKWTLYYSNFVLHYRNEDDYNRHPQMFGVERQGKRWLGGVASFRNSFHGSAAYAYVGRRFDSTRWPVYAKVTVGVLHGYEGENRLNFSSERLGLALALIPVIGMERGRFSAELAALGTSGLALRLGWTFSR